MDNDEKQSRGADMVGFDVSEVELDAMVDIAGTLDKIAAKLQGRGMDPVRARTIGTFYMAIKNLVEQREENDKIRHDLDTAVFNILTGMQTLVTEDHKLTETNKQIIETVQTLTAEVQRTNDLLELVLRSRWIALSNEYGTMKNGLQDLDLNTK